MLGYMYDVKDFRITPEQQRAATKLLRDARTRRGLTQAEAGRQAGVSQAVVSSLENQISEGVQAISLLKLLRFYGVEPNEFVGVLGLRTGREDQSPEQRVALQRIYRKFLDVPDQLKPQALSAMEMIVDGYSKRG